ncbi:DUF1350 domain-containing protein [Skeletonema marinoi]|uniref:DUF1350 domain-containing protein n=1 Tax=Skeletonema marinoi TaxID=267567 RepID=A0AAD9D6B5_9STRA|nr:DUF1350 domain-containing protein [Skeletonema marinoi]
MMIEQQHRSNYLRPASFIAAGAILLSASSSSSVVHSFQLPTVPSSNSHIRGSRWNNAVSSSSLFESSSSSLDSAEGGGSVASEWMAKEKQIEEQMDATTTTTTTNSKTTTKDNSSSSTMNSNNNVNNDGTTTHTQGRWEELHGNYILRPPPSQPPRALLHFLGGALVGASPQLTYRYLLERLSSNGYLIVATPYQLSFDHLTTCDEIIDKFEKVAPMLAREYGAVPVVGVGHSCGSLLHVLITSLFPDTPRAANALLSYNNRGVGEAVPFFEELIVPLFSDKERNGSRLIKAAIEVARDKYNGRVPSDEVLFNLIKELPSPIPGQSVNSLLGAFLGGDNGGLLSPSLISIPKPLRESLTNLLAEPTFDALTNAGITPLLLQSLDITQQIPKLIDEVEDGARDFVPTPDAMSSAARRAYRCRRTLLMQFENDNLDDSEQLESYLREAESRWEELHGNYILRPPPSQPPRALLHFLGGALVGASPQLTYRYLLERLSSNGYLIVATPYQLSFDHLTTCDEIIDKFEKVAPMLAREYGAVPVVGVGHSCGSLLHVLITSLFPDTPRAANALLSYNNRGVGEAVPFFEELIVPLFSDKERNGSRLIKAAIEVARDKYNGRVPSDEVLFNLIKELPKPTFDALTNAGITPLLLQSLDITQQIPKLIDEVEDGARDFVPTPDAMSSAARRAYRCRRTLLMQFENDNLDDSEQLESYLREAESVMKMKRPMITIDLQRKVLDGNHATPLLGPLGGEDDALREVLGTLGGVIPGGGGVEEDGGSRWEELHGNYILRPPPSQPPRALLHFLGGALVGASPQLTYRYLLERLSSNGYLIVATPYQLSFDHLTTCDEIIDKFEKVAPMLAREYGAVPVVGVGHSCGSLLHVLITSLFPDTPRAANALLSYNNRGVGEAVPFFEELIVPLFSDKERNGSRLIKAAIEVARDKYNGRVPSDEVLFNLIKELPSPIPGQSVNSLLGAFLGGDNGGLLSPSLISIPKPLRESLTNLLAEPTFDALTNAGITPLLLQSLDITQQIPKLIDEVEDGARDFVPTPDAMSSAARRAYRCRRTLLMQFENDNLDDSEQLESYLREAEKTTVLLCSGWIVISSEAIYAMLNTLQVFNVSLVVTAFTAWLWIKPVYFTRMAFISRSPRETAEPTPSKT